MMIDDLLYIFMISDVVVIQIKFIIILVYFNLLIVQQLIVFNVEMAHYISDLEF